MNDESEQNDRTKYKQQQQQQHIMNRNISKVMGKIIAN